MVNIRTGSVAVIGFLMLASGLALWVLGDTTTSTVPISLASTGVLWAPLLWLSGIIVLLSSAFANTLRIKNYLVWVVVLIGGYLAVFGVLVLIASNLLP
jgi:threonine/homoserine/homoserine lactone efflux protein